MTENLATALAAFQAKLPKISKSETANVGNYSYTYANLADISERVMPLLAEHGLSFIAMPTFSGDRFVLAYELLHASGESKAGEYPLPVGGSSPQVLGSAITYGRRYCLCAVTGVSPADDDDDGGAATRAATQYRHEEFPQTSQPAPAALGPDSSPGDVRRAIATAGAEQHLTVSEIAEDFFEWSKGEQIGTAATAVLLEYLAHLAPKDAA